MNNPTQSVKSQKLVQIGWGCFYLEALRLSTFTPVALNTKNVPVDVTRMHGSFSAWDYNNGPAFLQPVYKAVTVISLIRDNILTPQIKQFQQLLRIANVITVPWRQQKPQRVSQSIHYRMDFRAQSSPAASQCFVAPFFAPLPCWWTLIVVLSSIRVLSSTMSWAISSSKTCSQTPCRLHRRNRVYTLFQGPYRSGRSLQGIPVFSQYRIPLSMTRLSFPGLPPCAGFSGGNSSFTLFHCSSVNSCCFMPLLYCLFVYLSIFSLKTPSSAVRRGRRKILMAAGGNSLPRKFWIGIKPAWISSGSRINSSLIWITCRHQMNWRRTLLKIFKVRWMDFRNSCSN